MITNSHYYKNYNLDNLIAVQRKKNTKITQLLKLEGKTNYGLNLKDKKSHSLNFQLSLHQSLFSDIIIKCQ